MYTIETIFLSDTLFTMLVTVLLGSIFLMTVSINGKHDGTLSLGTRGYDAVVQSSAFVDKSTMIKEFFDSDYIVVTAPSRFGKSTNLDMIKRFCEITVDAEGNRVPTNSTTNYALFTRNNLNIYKYSREFFERCFGNYPVIYLSFKQLSSDNNKKFLSSFTRMVRKEFDRHYYLLSSNRLETGQVKELEQFYKKITDGKLDSTSLRSSIQFLSHLLYTQFNGTKCIVLIDDYDAPFQKFIFHTSSDVNQIVYFIQEFISNILKSNPFVERALINARLRCGILSASTNVMHHSFTETHPFNEYYGMNEAEVTHLAHKLNLQDSLPDIREWYGGYRVGESKIEMCNVFSIVNYLTTKQFDTYWVDTDYHLKLMKLCLHDGIYDKFMSLLTNETVEMVVVHKITMEHVLRLRKIVADPENTEIDNSGVNLFLNFMVDLGYFSILEKTNGKWFEEVYTVNIPNKEIRIEFERSLRDLNFKK